MIKTYVILLIGLMIAVPSFGDARAIDDVAGLELKNPRMPAAGLVTGGQPTVADLTALRARGVMTVINLRDPSETTKHDDPDIARRFNFDEAAATEALGLTYVNLPISSGEEINEANARRLDVFLRAAEGPVFLHCGSGNRVGALLALRAHYVDGQSPEQAIAFGQTAGLTSLEDVARAAMTSETEAADDGQ